MWKENILRLSECRLRVHHFTTQGSNVPEYQDVTCYFDFFSFFFSLSFLESFFLDRFIFSRPFLFSLADSFLGDLTRSVETTSKQTNATELRERQIRVFVTGQCDTTSFPYLYSNIQLFCWERVFSDQKKKKRKIKKSKSGCIPNCRDRARTHTGFLPISENTEENDN